MEGPIDPQHPDRVAGARQSEAPDGDLHALLERLLGQGDVRPSAPGTGEDLWPDIFAAPAVADEVSTIIPGPEAPTAVAELPLEIDESMAPAVDAAPVRAWEPVVVDSSATTTNVDDIHAAILASVSVELEPIVEAAEPVTEPELATESALATESELATAPDHLFDVEPVPPSDDAFDLWAAATDFAPPAEAPTVDEPALDDVIAELAAELPVEASAAEVESAPEVEPVVVVADVEAVVEVEAVAEAADSAASAEVTETVALDASAFAYAEAASVDDDDEAVFVLTPFDAPDAEASHDTHPDAEALWAAAVPQLGLDVAPLLDLDVVDSDVDDLPLAPIAVVLPWPSHEPKPVAPDAPTAHDLIEAALSGLHADLTSEPIEPLRTPDVAAATAHVVFRLGTRTMAIPLAAVSEIARPPKVTRLPHVPSWVLGIANLRGDIVSMLDLEGFFSGKSGKASHEQRMLALRPAGDEVRTAVLVDSVDGIQAFQDARVARVTRGYDAELAPYARGLYQLEDDLVVVLDADRLLQSKPMRQFEDGAGAR